MTTPAHRKTDSHGGWARHFTARRVALVAVGVIAVGAATSGIVIAAGHHSSGTSSAARTHSGTDGGPGSTGPASKSRTVSATQRVVPLTVRSITPAAAATGVATSSEIAITFSVAPSASAPDPTLSPAILGHWIRTGTRWVFHPRAGYLPSTKETVTIAPTTAADEGHHVVHLAAAFTSTFTLTSGSNLRLQQLLSDLHYLPFNFTRAADTVAGAAAPPSSASTTVAPATPGASSSTAASSTTASTAAAPAPTTAPTATTTPAPTTTTEATTAEATTTAAVTPTGLATEPTVADAVSTNPQRGRLTWAYGNIPASLAADWVEGKPNLLTQGAVMAFEADHGLGVDGIAGPEVWTALRAAVAARQVDPRPYNYIEVTEHEPETLTVWQDGNADVYSSPANTGAAGAATQLGTFPVYLRYTSHAMIGTNPDGTKYDDPDIPWIAYFNGGDAIHGYPRAEYGFPQSNGCVELPIPNAGVVFNSGDDWYGTLVNIS
jgi:peptidoglycan hydrolase-like protein with peptidoglycan-binding domain